MITKSANIQFQVPELQFRLNWWYPFKEISYGGTFLLRWQLQLYTSKRCPLLAELHGCFGGSNGRDPPALTFSPSFVYSKPQIKVF